MSEIKNYDITGGGITDYAELENKPSINGTTLVGNVEVADASYVDDNSEVVSAAINTLIRDKADASTSVTSNDISAFVTVAYVDASLALKQDTLTPGDGIIIKDNIISASVTDCVDTSTFNKNNLIMSSAINALIRDKQDTLVSGTNIKTINNESILGEGNLSVGGSATGTSFVDTVKDIPTTYNFVVATVTDSLELYLADKLDSGKSMSILIYNKADSEITITLPSTDSYVLITDSTSLKIETQKYAMVNIISDGNSMYVRA